jgi:chromosome segregation ATPase
MSISVLLSLQQRGGCLQMQDMILIIITMSKIFDPSKSNHFNSPRLPKPDSNERPGQEEIKSANQTNLWIPRFSDFLSKMLEQARRIAPSFKFNNCEGNLLEQVLLMFQQAVDIYLNRYHKRIVTHQKRKSHTEGLTDRPENLEELEAAKETMKNLVKYEKLLNSKEEKLLLKAEKLQEDLENFKIIKENFEIYLKTFENEKIVWHENKSKELEKIENDRKKLAFEKQNLEKLAKDLTGIKEKLEKKEEEIWNKVKVKEEQLETRINRSKDDLEEEKTRLQQDRLSFESEKWTLQSKISELEELTALLQLRQSHLEQEKSDLLQEKQLFRNQKSQLEQEKHEFNLSRKSSPTKSLQDTEGQSPNDQSMFNLSFEPILSQSIILPETRSPDPGLENVYLELNEQIEKINKELESRENALNTKEAELASLNHFLQEKMNEYKSIEESLLESKFHLEEFQLNTITEIEENSKIIVSLITKLNQLKHELEALVEKVLKQLNCIKKYSLNLEVIQEDPFESTPEVSPNFEFRFGFTEFEEFHKRLKEVERISESFSERMNSTGTVESELETSLDEKIRELSGLYVNKD